MLELNADNAVDYLRSAGCIAGPARVEVLSGGVSNIVLRVTTDDGPFILKQSRPQLRTAAPWFSDVSRIYREQEVMEALQPVMPAGMVPRILFADRANYVFAMSHAPPDARVWKDDLLGGRFDERLAGRVGEFLGIMHESTACRRDRFEAFADARVFEQLRVDPFYRRVQEVRPEIAEPIAALVEQMLSLREALCHGDFTPKNMLVHGDDFVLVDYETAYFGDPAMDLGLFLAHLLLKAFRRPDWADQYLTLTRALWAGYRAKISFRPVYQLESRGIAHLGACLLARIDGTSPVDYLPDEATREAVRGLGRQLLLDKVRNWPDVEALVRCCFIDRDN